MNTKMIANISLLVGDYDDAIDFYTGALGFVLVEDTPLGAGKRWVRVAPAGDGQCCLLLARADGAEQQAHVGNQAGGRVFLFLNTDDFWRDYEKMRAGGVSFLREPVEEPYGTVAVFEDLYDNQWDLIQPKGL